MLVGLILFDTFTKTHPQHPHRQHKLCENCTSDSSTETPLETPDETSTAAAFHQFEVSSRRPVYILFPLPTGYDKVRNPFEIILNKVEPLVDIALDDVYERGLLENGSIKTIFGDSQMSDAHGPK